MVTHSILPAVSPAAALQPAFPPPARPALATYQVPDAFHIPIDSIERPDHLPRLLLLGERDDASFQRYDDGFTTDYVWPALTQGPVCRLQLRDRVLQVEELWDGERVFCSTGSGTSLTECLGYHFYATLALRDSRRVFPDGHVAPYELDPREPFFFSWCRDRLGIRWKLPAPGPRLHVDQPAGILRALVVPCAPEQGAILADLASAFVQRQDVWTVDDRSAATRCGRFSCRTANVSCRPPVQASVQARGEMADVEPTECRIFVGGMRSVIELATFLADQGWDLTGHRFHAFICFPHDLVKPYRNLQGWQDEEHGLDVFYPALLPPQAGLGVADGAVPAALGDTTAYRAGGNEEGLGVLRQAAEEAFPPGGQPVLYAMANPRAPSIQLHRSNTGHTVPVLCVLADEDTATPSAIFHLIYEATGKWLKLGHQVESDAGTFCVFPNIPDLTHCYDAEGFFHLLPAAARELEQELGTAWLVEEFHLGGTHEGRQLTGYVSAGPRQEGW
jgi:hypothetical protein